MDFTVESLHAMEKDMNSEFQKLLKAVNVTSASDLSETVLLKLNKNPLANTILRLVNVLEKNLNICKSAASKIDNLKSEQIENQKKLLEVQQEKMDSVQKTVQTEMKSWSDIVKKNCEKSAPSLNSMKKVVQSVVQDDVRSKNFIIYGAPEANGGCTRTGYDVAKEVLEEIWDYAEDYAEAEDRPSSLPSTDIGRPVIVTGVRIGNKKPINDDEKPRPCKVTLASPEAVRLVLARARYLKKSSCAAFHSWYITPDRNSEERAAHKKLVIKMKNMITTEPQKYHYIRDGKIHSVDKRTENENVS